MKTNLILVTFSISLLPVLLSCIATMSQQPDQAFANSGYGGDTVEYTILGFDATDRSIFEHPQPADLTQAEIQEIENILARHIMAYNQDQQLQFDSISKAHPGYDLKMENFIINLSRYKRQYVPVINRAGHKQVWVNCFCNTSRNWREEIVKVRDGGNCYFSLVINLTTGAVSRFMVNDDV